MLNLFIKSSRDIYVHSNKIFWWLAFLKMVQPGLSLKQSMTMAITQAAMIREALQTIKQINV